LLETVSLGDSVLISSLRAGTSQDPTL